MAENINDIANFKLSGMRRQANELLMAVFKRGYYHGVAECCEEFDRDDSIRWIPMEEKLPPVGSRLLTCDDDGICYTSLKYYGEDGWRWSAECERSDIDIVAWMPMPEPYKVVEEEKPKTRAEKFYEMFPNCARVHNVRLNREMPSCCWRDIVGGLRMCDWNSVECYACWDEPYDGEFEEEEKNDQND